MRQILRGGRDARNAVSAVLFNGPPALPVLANRPAAARSAMRSG